MALACLHMRRCTFASADQISVAQLDNQRTRVMRDLYAILNSAPELPIDPSRPDLYHAGYSGCTHNCSPAISLMRFQAAPIESLRVGY